MGRPGRALVVVDPTAGRQPAFERGVAVAARLGLQLSLLVCIHGDTPPRVPAGREVDVRRRLLERELARLKELAAGATGIDVETKAVWDKPLHEAIIRETLRSEPRLVMKDTHFHPAISRALVTNTDWHLIRDCPAPLWLVRGDAWRGPPRVVAFVDPLHEYDRPAALDHRILAEGARVATALGGELHAVHCHDTTGLAAAPGLPGSAAPADLVAGSRATHATALGSLAATAGVPGERTHLRRGAPAAAITAAAGELGADLAVMGAVSRSGLQRIFLGSTAEQVLDRLPCDVLVVKPEGFRTPVAYRPQAPDFAELH